MSCSRDFPAQDSWRFMNAWKIISGSDKFSVFWSTKWPFFSGEQAGLRKPSDVARFSAQGTVVHSCEYIHSHTI